MKLQLLIPQYKETDDVVRPLLDSLKLQQGIDLNEVGVIICNDGSDVHLSDEFINSYPFKVEYYLCPHQGVSETRNECLRRATADYVMFCDADDMFMMSCGLWMVFREMNEGFDSMVSVFVEETKISGEYNYIHHAEDPVFVHGKIHRRQYLIDKNIWWNPKLTIHEDSYFNVLCRNLSENIKYCPTPFYLWKWRDDSVCRHDPKYILKTYTNMIDSNDALITEFLKRGMQDKAQMFCTSFVLESYYTMNKLEWINQENKGYRLVTEKYFGKYFQKWHTLWDTTPINDRLVLSSQIRERNIFEGMQFEAQTIEDWLKYIKKLNKGGKTKCVTS